MIQVQLRSFRIQNFRSIIDTGWKNLASDNITILIGQNESGKTSILEALHSFHNGTIIEDILRSDQSLPIVSCGFTIENDNVLSELLDLSRISKDLADKIKDKNTFYLTRKWKGDKTSEVYIAEDEIFDYYRNIEIEENKVEEQTINLLESILTESESNNDKLKLVTQEKAEEEQKLTEKRKILEDFNRALKKAKKPDLKLIAENDAKLAQKEYDSQEKNYLQKAEEYDTIRQLTHNLNERLEISLKCNRLIDEGIELTNLIKEIHLEVQDYRHFYEISTSFKDQKKNKLKLEIATKKLKSYSENKSLLEQDRKFQLLVASKVINETLSIKSAEFQANKEIQEKQKYYSLSQLGEALMVYIPIFEFFEDFSGLLPNKIDLEDIINEHKHLEGYKAARNFLNLAGLNPSFFREKNQRILKQRIATLNSDVSVNFQDYWSQQVGKDSKIKLHFELEHYDYTVPEKSGKPYLEFWIRDKKERLYPKQRSRGVRWFLSFYLELKAASSQNKNNRVLLIDEPGLSLHARAQEDVLKVFEDLKDSMQIIYCTHSPHLVNTEKLYRVLAVQRANEEDDKSESIVYEPTALNKASADTLTPIYSLMGIRLSDQQFINNSNNVIVPDTTTYYYMHWLSKLIPGANKINFIPASNSSTIPLLINILESWNVGFGILLFEKGNSALPEYLQQDTLLENKDSANNKIVHLKNYDSIEDIFSTLDFKKYILLKREGITDTNSRYIITNNLSRKILATNFVHNFDDKAFNFEKFDEATRKNIKDLFKKVISII